MDTYSPAEIQAAAPGETTSAGKRQRRSLELKRCIVEETLVVGASVARVARAHGVNANQVFYCKSQSNHTYPVASSRAEL